MGMDIRTAENTVNKIKISGDVLSVSGTGLLVGFMYEAGRQLDGYDTLDLSAPAFYLRWLAKGCIASLLIFLLWKALDRLRSVCAASQSTRDALPPPQNSRPHQSSRILQNLQGASDSATIASDALPVSRGISRHLLYTVFLLLCWTPIFLSLLPGAFSYDARAEWEQMKTGAITAHHPVLHVLLAGGLPEIAHRLTGSYNLGIGAYTVLQMVLAANILASAVSYMTHRTGWKPTAALILLFYGFSPVLQLSVICATKDVPFALSELLFMIFVLRLAEERPLFFTYRRWQVGFVLTALGTMIFRNNGLYIVLVMLPVLFFFCKKHCGYYCKKYLLLAGAVLLLYGIYAGPVYALLSVTPGGVEEMLSLPIQQLARVHRYDYDSLESQDLEQLYRVLPRKYLEQYKPTVADPVKAGFDREGFAADPGAFFALWVRLGLRHPLTYINSFLVSTVDFWYPGAVMDGYKDPYGRSNYFDYRVDGPGEEAVLLSGIHDWYERIAWDRTAQQVPFAFLALSPGWYFLVFLVIGMYLWRRRETGVQAVLLIPFLTIATVLPGPMALVRYVLIFFYAFPLLLTRAVSIRAH